MKSRWPGRWKAGGRSDEQTPREGAGPRTRMGWGQPTLHRKRPARGYKLRAEKNFHSEKKSFQTFQTFQSTLTGFL